MVGVDAYGSDTHCALSYDRGEGGGFEFLYLFKDAISVVEYWDEE
jgi:hypothetical protein